MKAIRYEKDAVLIQKGKIKAWVDVVIDKEDVVCDWNKYIFYLNRRSDVILRSWQDEIENFEEATNLAIETLEKFGVVYQDENGKWYTAEKYHTIKGSIAIQ
jgi:hypothetical protein